MMLSVENLWKTYENQPLLCDLSFRVEEGETVCLLGPSGSGKSTILRIVAGLEKPERGRVVWNGQDVTDLPVHRRNFGLMFQDYALFPHRSVAENIAFGLRMQHSPTPQIQTRVREALARVNLSGFEHRRVTDLSGGEQQRVALARALAPNPRLLMLDEPLGALDRTLRERLGEELRHILHETHIPAIYVTHDQEEAFTLADRLLLLHAGRVIQAGTPAEVYARPVSAWVARFFGLGNLVTGRVVETAPLKVQTTLGVLTPACLHGKHAVGETLTLLLRPDAARPVVASGPHVMEIQARVTDVVFQGQGFRVTLAWGGQELRFFFSQAPQMGQTLTLELKPDSVLCLERAEEAGGSDGC